MKLTGWKRVVAVFLALDIALATLLFGTEGVTVSRVAAEAERDGATWGAVTCYVLELFDENHCEWALEDK